MQDQGFAPGIGMVDAAGVQVATVVKDDGAGGHRAGGGFGQGEITGMWDVVDGLIGVVADVEEAVMVRARDVLHTAVFECGFVQGDPRSDEGVFRLDPKIALVLVNGFGLAAGGFEQHLVAEDFDAGADEPSDEVCEFGISRHGPINGIEAHEEGYGPDGFVLGFGARFVRHGVAFSSDGNTFGCGFGMGDQVFGATADR